MGILIANGRRLDLLPRFLEMMELCISEVRRPPTPETGNNFSVSELVSCILELRESDAVEKERLDRWANVLGSLDPWSAYTAIACSSEDRPNNWALFAALSEQMKAELDYTPDREFIELQLSTQVIHLDENGMYRDPHEPMVYDLVSRALLALLLRHGYRGRYLEVIDSALRSAGLMTPDMQSACGEIPFGGRSNGFLNNEPWLAAVCEHEAKRYADMGDELSAMLFRSAALRALAVTERWLSSKPIRHLKNHFPQGDSYGCEGYAYFDKYMISTASVIFMAYDLCDPTLEEAVYPQSNVATVTSEHFHKLFLRAGGYSLELDTNADRHYDSSGVGKLQREGAPEAICISIPATKTPSYQTCGEGDDLSLSAGTVANGDPTFLCDGGFTVGVSSLDCDAETARATLTLIGPNGERADWDILLSDQGVELTLNGEGELAMLLPALDFDGEERSVITENERQLTVAYRGCACIYTASDRITPTDRLGRSRCGHYKGYITRGNRSLRVKIKILRGTKDA